MKSQFLGVWQFESVQEFLKLALLFLQCLSLFRPQFIYHPLLTDFLWSESQRSSFSSSAFLLKPALSLMPQTKWMKSRDWNKWEANLDGFLTWQQCAIVHSRDACKNAGPYGHLNIWWHDKNQLKILSKLCWRSVDELDLKLIKSVKIWEVLLLGSNPDQNSE